MRVFDIYLDDTDRHTFLALLAHEGRGKRWRAWRVYRRRGCLTFNVKLSTAKRLNPDDDYST